jgi:uncharacterized protein (TIGR03790 family)
MAKVWLRSLPLVVTLWSSPVHALSAAELGVLYRSGDAQSEQIARDYSKLRNVPTDNVVGIEVPRDSVISPATLEVLRASAWKRLPARVHALLLVWTRPYAAGCMSITTAFAAGYRPEFCEPGCAATALSPLYDADSLDPAIRLGWRIAMLFPVDDLAEARALGERGVRADGSHPTGTVYLVETYDTARNVRAVRYTEVMRAYENELRIRRVSDMTVPRPLDVLLYFTGAAKVSELGALGFRPGAAADHLTSAGGVLDQNGQTTALEWIRAGATGSYGTVSEPCNHLEKFPSPMVFIGRYLRGDTLIEAYWKSVAMPGQGLFVGEPLAAPYLRVPPATRRGGMDLAGRSRGMTWER